MFSSKVSELSSEFIKYVDWRRNVSRVGGIRFFSRLGWGVVYVCLDIRELVQVNEQFDECFRQGGRV